MKILQTKIYYFGLKDLLKFIKLINLIIKFLYYINENSMITELSSIKNNRIINCFSNVRFLEDSIVLYIDSEKFKLFYQKNILTERINRSCIEKKIISYIIL